MKGSQLKFLAATAEIARLDLPDTGSPITLMAGNGRLHAVYNAAYSSGTRNIMDAENPTLNVAVHATKFRELAALFPDEADVRLAVEGSSLVVSGAGMNLTLATRPDRQPFEAGSLKDMACVSGELDVLLSEVALAQHYVAKSMAKPVFGGIRIQTQGERLVLQAFDGAAVLFGTAVKTEGTLPETIPPAYDFQVGLKLLNAGTYKLWADRNRIVIGGESGWFRCATQTGEWPNFAGITARVDRVPVELPADVIRAVNSAAKTLDTGSEIILEAVSADASVIRTPRMEFGELRIAVPTAVPMPYKFDVAVLALAAQLGNPVKLELPLDAKKHIRAASGSRVCYFAQRV